jgi:hypothetical protein
MDDMDRANRGSEDEDGSSSTSKPNLLHSRLKTLVSYIKSGFAPAVSVLALIFSLFALNAYHANQQQLSEAALRIDTLSSSLAESKTDVDFFKAPIAREKAIRSEERRKQVERETKIIKSVTQLQARMKISPSLEEQLRELEVASAPVVSSSLARPASAPAETSSPAKVVASGVPNAASAVAVPVPAATDKNKKPVVTTTDKKLPITQKAAEPKPVDKTPTKTKALKEAIESFNRSQ